MKINYNLLMNNEIEKIKSLPKKPALLLHACCAPCSSAVLERLSKYFDITLFFYNPNISPESEFIFRLEELKRLTGEMNLADISVISPAYDNSEFDAIAYGLENVPEGGERCRKCYRLRLGRATAFAKENGFDYFTTTLSISPHKNAAWLNEAGEEFSKAYDIKYLYSDFKKEEGYKRSCTLSKQYGLYRQSYCGCIYSKHQAEKRGVT